MKKYLKYFSYVFRHKWYVYLECRKWAMRWQGFIHDWSKFLPSEAVPYANFFYGGDKRKDSFYNPKDGSDEFNRAWLLHQHRNPHHWQYWLLQNDDGTKLALKMPIKYALEMVCDWVGAGKASGHNDVKGWYWRNKDKMILHEDTRAFVEEMLGWY